MKTRFFLPQLVGVCAVALVTNVQAQTNGTLDNSPGTNTGTANGAGTGASGQPATALGQRAPGQAGTALGQRAPGQAGTALGQPGPALGPPAPAISQPRTPALGQRRNTATGQQGTTAIGQQGSGTPIMPSGTTPALTPFGAGNNNVNPSGKVTPGVEIQPTKPVPGTITNGFIVNNDGSKTALPGAGSTAITPGGTNTGTGGTSKNFFSTNTFRNP